MRKSKANVGSDFIKFGSAMSDFLVIGWHGVFPCMGLAGLWPFAISRCALFTFFCKTVETLVVAHNLLYNRAQYPWSSLRLKCWRFLQSGLSFWFLWALQQQRHTIWSMPKLLWVRNNQLVMWVTLFFGLVHGFGFAGYFELIRDANSPCGVLYYFLHWV